MKNILNLIFEAIPQTLPSNAESTKKITLLQQIIATENIKTEVLKNCRKALKEPISADQESFTLFIKIIEIYNKYGELKDAAKCYEKLLSVSTDKYLSTLVEVGYCDVQAEKNLREGNFSRAIFRYNEVLPRLEMLEEISSTDEKFYSQRVEILNKRGDVLKQDNKLQDAYISYRHALNLVKNDDFLMKAIMLNNVAAIYQKQGALKRALDYLQLSSKLLPKLSVEEAMVFNSLFNKIMGDVYSAQYKSDEALVYYNNAKKIIMEHPKLEGDLQYEITEVQLNAEITNLRNQEPSQIEERDTELKAHLGTLSIQNISPASTKADMLNHLKTLSKIILIYKSKGMIEKVLDYCNMALRPEIATYIHDDHTEMYFDMIEIYKECSKLEEAEQCYERLESMFLIKHRIPLYNLMKCGRLCTTAEIFSNKKDYDTAIDYYMKINQFLIEGGDSVEELSFMKVEMLNNVGETRVQKGELNKALMCYKEALKLVEDEDFLMQTILYNNIVEIYTKKGKIDNAQEYFIKSLNAMSQISIIGEKGWVQSLVDKNAGDLYNAQGLLVRAKKHYDQALKLITTYAPEHPDLKFELFPKELEGKIAVIEQSMLLSNSSAVVHGEAHEGSTTTGDDTQFTDADARDLADSDARSLAGAGDID